METITQLIELFPYALLGGVVAGIICGFLGVFVVSQRVVFLGASLTQAAIAGVAFSFLHILDLEGIVSSLFGVFLPKDTLLHSFEPLFFSLLFAIAAVLIFSQTHRQKYFTQDGMLGIMFVVAIATRIMLIQKSPAAEVSEIESILKGDILFIGKSEFWILSVLLVIVAGIFIMFQKQLKFVVFDPDSASAHGIKSGFWLLFFYLVVGIGISLTTRFVGDVFTFAFLIIPSTIGIMISKTVKGVFAVAVIIGAVIPPVAIYFAFKMDFSSGPAAVILSFILFLTVFLVKKLRNS